MTTLRREFIEHASVEAIRHELGKARAALSRQERHVARLSELLSTRLDQIDAGEWPKAAARGGEDGKP